MDVLAVILAGAGVLGAVCFAAGAFLLGRGIGRMEGRVEQLTAAIADMRQEHRQGGAAYWWIVEMLRAYQDGKLAERVAEVVKRGSRIFTSSSGSREPTFAQSAKNLSLAARRTSRSSCAAPLGR